MIYKMEMNILQKQHVLQDIITQNHIKYTLKSQ